MSFRLKAPPRTDGGQWWEEQIIGWLLRYQDQDRCSGEKTYPPHLNKGVITERGRRYFKGVYTGFAKPDISARLDGTARAWRAEAKEFLGKRWDFDGLPEHQAKDLDEILRRGGGAYVFIRGVDVDRAWLVPWRLIGDRWWAWASRPDRAAPGSASLSLQDLEAAAIYTAHPAQFDFLPALLADMEASRVRA